MNTPLSPPAVRRQLERLLASQTFQACWRLQELLRYLVEETLAGRARHLKAYTLGVDVFKRDPAFDPLVDPIVRVQATRLRRLLDKYYRDEGSGDNVIINLPKGGYVPVFNRAEYSSRREPPKLTRLPESAAVPTIGVCAFANLTGDSRQDHLCRGLTVELESQLIRQRTLPVIINGCRDVTMKQADYAITGSVYDDGGGCRWITVMLRQAMTGRGLWSQSYRCRSMDTAADMPDRQQEIAVRIAATLAGPHGLLCRTIRAAGAENTCERTAMALFRTFCEQLSSSSHDRARQALEKASVSKLVTTDIWSALAHVHLAEHSLGFTRHSGVSTALERAANAARQALALDPTNASGHCALALVHYHEKQPASFLDSVGHCLALETCNRVDVLAPLGMYLCFAGDWQRGLAMLDKAVQLNPLCPTWLELPRALHAYRRADYAQALVAARRINLPGFFWDPLLQLMIHAQLDRRLELKVAADQLITLKPDVFQEIKRLLDHFLQDDALIDRCLDGFDKARALLDDDSGPGLRINDKVA
jgi:TolB-like protein